MNSRIYQPGLNFQAKILSSNQSNALSSPEKTSHTHKKHKIMKINFSEVLQCKRELVKYAKSENRNEQPIMVSDEIRMSLISEIYPIINPINANQKTDIMISIMIIQYLQNHQKLNEAISVISNSIANRIVGERDISIIHGFSYVISRVTQLCIVESKNLEILFFNEFCRYVPWIDIKRPFTSEEYVSRYNRPKTFNTIYEIQCLFGMILEWFSYDSELVEFMSIPIIKNIINNGNLENIDSYLIETFFETTGFIARETCPNKLNQIYDMLNDKLKSYDIEKNFSFKRLDAIIKSKKLKLPYTLKSKEIYISDPHESNKNLNKNSCNVPNDVPNTNNTDLNNNVNSNNMPNINNTGSNNNANPYNVPNANNMEVSNNMNPSNVPNAINTSANSNVNPYNVQNINNTGVNNNMNPNNAPNANNAGINNNLYPYNVPNANNMEVSNNMNPNNAPNANNAGINNNLYPYNVPNANNMEASNNMNPNNIPNAINTSANNNVNPYNVQNINNIGVNNNMNPNNAPNANNTSINDNVNPSNVPNINNEEVNNNVNLNNISNINNTEVKTNLNQTSASNSELITFFNSGNEIKHNSKTSKVIFNKIKDDINDIIKSTNSNLKTDINISIKLIRYLEKHQYLYEAVSIIVQKFIQKIIEDRKVSSIHGFSYILSRVTELCQIKDQNLKILFYNEFCRYIPWININRQFTAKEYLSVHKKTINMFAIEEIKCLFGLIIEWFSYDSVLVEFITIPIIENIIINGDLNDIDGYLIETFLELTGFVAHLQCPDKLKSIYEMIDTKTSDLAKKNSLKRLSEFIKKEPKKYSLPYTLNYEDVKVYIPKDDE